jgi:hypothetical protein
MMKKVFTLMAALIVLAFAGTVSAAPVYLDIATATFTATGPQTLNGANVDALTADGAIYNCTFEWNPNTYNWVLTSYYVSGYKNDDPKVTNANKLLGIWNFVYHIGSSYTNDQTYKMHTVDTGDTNDEGGYYVWGDDEYGNKNSILASYYPTSGYFALLDPGSIIHRFFIFPTITGNTTKGDYYQITVSTGEWSNKYSFEGTKTALPSQADRVGGLSSDPSIKTFIEKIERERAQSLVGPNAPAFAVDPDVQQIYEILKEKTVNPE